MPEYVVADTLLLKVTCEEDGAAINLASSELTATLRWSINGGTSVTGAMTKVDAANGIVSRQWLPTELDEAGTVAFEVYITDDNTAGANDLVYTSEIVTRDIRDKL